MVDSECVAVFVGSDQWVAEARAWGAMRPRKRLRQAPMPYAETGFALLVQDAPQPPATKAPEVPEVDERQLDMFSTRD